MRATTLTSASDQILWIVSLLLFMGSTPLSADAISPADAKASHDKMVATLAANKRDQAQNNPYYSDAPIRSLQQSLNGIDRSKEKGRFLLTLMRLGNAYVDYGDIEKGIQQLTALDEALAKVNAPESQKNQVAFHLGIAHLRLAETENCCASHAPESCILPLQGAAIHTHRTGSEAAINYFKKSISLSFNDEPKRHFSQWLLNLAYMTLGEYPEKVPAELRLPAAMLQSKTPFPRFKNVAAKWNLASDSLAGGVIADDFDNDGDFDLLVSNWDSSASLRYFENRLADGFVETTKTSGLTEILGGLNMVQADFDNDGDTDVLVLRGAWLSVGGSVPNSLLRNEGDGKFVDITYAAGLAEQNYPTQTAAWMDYDNDGDLDIYIGNEQWGGSTAPSQLFRNNGDSTFTDVAVAAGVTNGAIAKAVVCGDLNGDRLPDIMVSNFQATNRLYQNNGDGTFTDIAEKAGIQKPLESFPAWIWDFDNDGSLDVFISSYSAKAEDITRKALGMPNRRELSGHYRGDGKGGFIDVAKSQGFDTPMLTMGSNFGDLNNDGFLDMYLGSGTPDIAQIMPNSLFLNQAGKSFADVTMASGLGHLQKGHAVAFLDFDQDGDLDVFEQMGGAKRVDSYRDALYLNPGFDNHWLGVKLTGTKSNRSAIGAQLHLTIEENGKLRSIYRHVNSGGSFGGNPLQQHIGVGAAEVVAKLEIFWPTSGETQVFKNVPANQTIHITEGSEVLK